MSIIIVNRKGLKEYERERREFQRSVIRINKRSKQVVASPQPPEPRRDNGGSGLICAYPLCYKEAREYCPKCYLPFCDKHIDKYIHGCLGEWLHLYVHGNYLNTLQRNVSELGRRRRLAVTPRFREAFEEASYEDIVNELSKTYPHMSSFLSNLEKKFDEGRRMTVSDMVKYVLCILCYKLLKFSKEHKKHKVIIMSSDVYEALQKFPQDSRPRIGGLAFQWWISLEILDLIMKYCKLIDSNYEKRLFQFSVPGSNVRLWIYFDSLSREDRFSGKRLRPDICAQLLEYKYKSSQSFRILPIMRSKEVIERFSEKVIEIKLSQSALEKSMDQFKRYLDRWGEENVVLAIGTPCSMHLNVRKYDSLITMGEERLANALKEMIEFLLM